MIKLEYFNTPDKSDPGNNMRSIKLTAGHRHWTIAWGPPQIHSFDDRFAEHMPVGPSWLGWMRGVR